MLLSSGELPVETKLIEDAGRKIRAGQLVRLLDIAADRGLGHGALDHAGEYGAGHLTDAIKRAAVTAYGTAGPAFIRHLIKMDDKQIATARKAIDSFASKLAGDGCGDQVKRAAMKFALIAFAGEIAARFDVVPWQSGEARTAATWAFERWVARRGGTGAHEETQAIEQVRQIIERYGEARFQRVDDSLWAGHDRFGWRKGEGAEREWWVPTETWKREVCNGLDPSFVARTLASRGMLRKKNDGRIQCAVRLGNGQVIKAYVLTAAILDSGETGGESKF
jgi:uncharacterized protein (DUF927 family)